MTDPAPSDAPVRHPIEEYAPGSERLERLYRQMEEAHRWQQPNEVTFNM